MLAIGFESPIAEELEAMDKHLKPEQMIDLARTYHRAGFRMHGMFIFGYPARESKPFAMSAMERVKHFRRFIRKSKLDTVQVMLPGPLPGTELTARLEAQGRIYPIDTLGLEYYDGNFPLFEPDPPLTPESMQAAVNKIMGHVYSPNSLFNVGLSILSFPAMVFHFHRLRRAWQQWYRRWSRGVYRTGGWLLLRKWSAEFREDGFTDKLSRARKQIRIT